MPSIVSRRPALAPLAAVVVALGCQRSGPSGLTSEGSSSGAPPAPATSNACPPCSTPPGSPLQGRGAAPGKEASSYRALDANWPRLEGAPRGSLEFEINWAARAETLGDARHRWQQVLARYQRPDGEHASEIRARLVQVARLELARVHYLLGETEPADRLLTDAASGAGVHPREVPHGPGPHPKGVQ